MFDVKRPFELCCLGDLPHPKLFPRPVCSSLWQILMALTSETSWCLTETHALFLVSRMGLSGTLAFSRTFLQGLPCHRLLWPQQPSETVEGESMTYLLPASYIILKPASCRWYCQVQPPVWDEPSNSWATYGAVLASYSFLGLPPLPQAFPLF